MRTATREEVVRFVPVDVSEFEHLRFAAAEPEFYEAANVPAVKFKQESLLALFGDIVHARSPDPCLAV